MSTRIDWVGRRNRTEETGTSGTTNYTDGLTTNTDLEVTKKSHLSKSGNRENDPELKVFGFGPTQV